MENNQIESATGICDVHYWAKNDSKEREVEWCDVCQAWICKECESNLALRALAMVKRKKNQLLG